MTTATWASTVDHYTDAGFRAWGSELSTKLASVGLVKVTDAGNNNIDWTTATRPALNTDAGYEIWRFNDTQQSAAPIYIKLLYGTGGYSVNTIRLGFQVGSGVTNGTLNGQNTVISYGTTSSAPKSNTTATPSYLSYSDGFFGIIYKLDGYNNAGYCQSLIIARTVDSTTQAPTSEGAVVYDQAASYNQLRFAATASNNRITTVGVWGGCTIPNYGTYTSTSTFSGSSIPRTFLHWSYTPQIKPLIGICTVNTNDLPGGTVFSTTLLGSTPRTYLAWWRGSGSYGTPWAESVSTSTYALAMLWE